MSAKKPWYMLNRGPGFPDGEFAPSLPIGDLFRFKLCPDCKGKGYFVINPLHPGSCEASCGSGNMTQCRTCVRVMREVEACGKIPDDVLSRMTPESKAELERLMPLPEPPQSEAPTCAST